MSNRESAIEVPALDRIILQNTNHAPYSQELTDDLSIFFNKSHTY